MKPHLTFAMALLATMFTVAATPGSAFAQTAEEAYLDIQETYGTTPGFFHLVPRDMIVEAWGAFTNLQINPDRAIDAKTRELIGIAVAAQNACKPCVYFHVAAAVANGASQGEMIEALDVGTATRHLDSVLVHAGSDMNAFKRETDLVLWGDARTVQLKAPPMDLWRLLEAQVQAAGN